MERLPLRLRQLIAFVLWAVGFTALVSWLYDGEFTLASVVTVAAIGIAVLASYALGERAWRRMRREDDLPP